MPTSAETTGRPAQLRVSVQYAHEEDEPPSAERVRRLVAAALGAGEVTVRFVDAAESARLNRRWRGKPGATNVLAFPYDAATGDIVVCMPLAAAEALERGDTVARHSGRLVVHGALHLAGMDHRNDREEAEMKAAEDAILAREEESNDGLGRRE